MYYLTSMSLAVILMTISAHSVAAFDNFLKTTQSNNPRINTETSSSNGDDGFVNIYFLDATEISIDKNISDCSEVSEELSTLSDPILYLGSGNVSQDVLDFSKIWMDAGGTFSADTGINIHVVPAVNKNVVLSVLTISDADWQENPSLNNRNLAAANVVSDCWVAEEVDYYSTDLELRSMISPKIWRSHEAIENQYAYDTEPFDFFKVLFGYQGIGYGDYLAAGLHYQHNTEVPGTTSSYNSFGLFLALDAFDPDEYISQIIPDSIARNMANNWTHDCRNIALSVADNLDFLNSGVTIRGETHACEENSIFFSSDSIPSIPASDSEDFLTYLKSSTALHKFTLPLNDLGEPILCDNQNTVSEDSCSQIILDSWEPIMKGFVRQEHDVYLKVDFYRYTTKIFRLSSTTGDIDEIDM